MQRKHSTTDEKTTQNVELDSAYKPRSGPGPSNTDCSNPKKAIELFAEAFGYLEECSTNPNVHPMPAAKKTEQSSGDDGGGNGPNFLTEYCQTSSIFEGFKGDRPERGFRGYAPQGEGTEENPRLLAHGVDSLVLSVTVQVCPTVLETLGALKEKAAGATVRLHSGPFRFEIQKFGLSPHWAFVLKSSAVTIKIRSRPSYDLNVQADFRSAFLWSVGPDNAVRLVREFLDRIALQDGGKLKGLGVPVSARSVLFAVSRVDLCADFWGIDFTGSEISEGRFITRSRRRTVYTQAETPEGEEKASELAIEKALEVLKGAPKNADLGRVRKDVMAALGWSSMSEGERLREHVRGAAYHTGSTLSGFSFGAGHIVARIYRKDIEIKSSGKRWFREIWGMRGYPKGEAPPVWRVEFQLRAEGLKTFYAGGAPISSWQDFRRCAGSVWSALTAGTEDRKGWLSLRTPGKDKKRERWKFDQRWKTVQAVRWAEPVSLERITRGQIIRGAETPDRIRTKAEMISAWCAGEGVSRLTGEAAAARLGPQLVGIAAAYAAAVQVSEQRADPEGGAETEAALIKGLRKAMEAAPPGADAVGGAADRMVIRANWKRKCDLQKMQN